MPFDIIIYTPSDTVLLCFVPYSLKSGHVQPTNQSKTLNRAQNQELAVQPWFAELSKQGSTVDHDIYFPLIASKIGNQTDLRW